MDTKDVAMLVAALAGVIVVLGQIIKTLVGMAHGKGMRHNGGNGKNATSQFVARLGQDKMLEQVADLHRDRDKQFSEQEKQTEILLSMDATLKLVKDRLPRPGV